MKNKWKQRWVEALRSGEYEQGSGQLRSEYDAYCCLGVLCDLVDPEEWNKPNGEHNYKFAGTYGSLPGIIKRLLNIDVDVENSLVKMNDIENKSFVEIADWIEENL